MYRQSKQAVQQVLDSGKQRHEIRAAKICNNKIYKKASRPYNMSASNYIKLLSQNLPLENVHTK